MEIETISTVATSLGAKRVCDKAVEHGLSRLVVSERVTDASAIRACLQFADDHRIVTEPACGAALAVYEEKAVLDSFSNILVIVCGGATTTLEQLMLMRARLDIKGV